MKVKIVSIFILSLIVFVSVKAQSATVNYPNFCGASIKSFKYGSSSNSIKELQQILSLENGKNLNSTGYFGATTKSQIKIFQKNNKLTQNGEVTNNTLSLLKNKYCKNIDVTNSTSTVQVSSTTKTTFDLNSGINIKDIIEVKDGFTLYERDVPDTNTVVVSTTKPEEVTHTKPEILKLESSVLLGIGRNDLFVNWDSVNFDSCNLFFVTDAKFVDGKFVPLKRDQILTDVKPVGNYNTVSNKLNLIGQTNILDYKKNSIVIQLECTNKSKKLIERKTGFFDLSLNDFK